MMNTEELEPVTGLLLRTSTTLRRDVLEGTEQLKKKKEKRKKEPNKKSKNISCLCSYTCILYIHQCI